MIRKKCLHIIELLYSGPSLPNSWGNSWQNTAIDVLSPPPTSCENAAPIATPSIILCIVSPIIIIHPTELIFLREPQDELDNKLGMLSSWWWWWAFGFELVFSSALPLTCIINMQEKHKCSQSKTKFANCDYSSKGKCRLGQCKPWLQPMLQPNSNIHTLYVTFSRQSQVWYFSPQITNALCTNDVISQCMCYTFCSLKSVHHKQTSWISCTRIWCVQLVRRRGYAFCLICARRAN